MSAALKKLADEALDLTPDERVSLAHKLLVSCEPEPSAAVEAAWDTEIRKRIDQFDKGQTSSRPAQDVFDDLKKRFS